MSENGAPVIVEKSGNAELLGVVVETPARCGLHMRRTFVLFINWPDIYYGNKPAFEPKRALIV